MLRSLRASGLTRRAALCSDTWDSDSRPPETSASTALPSEARVLAQPVFRARRPKRGTRPLCRAKTVKLFKAYRQRYWGFKKAFHAAYQRARDQVVAGISPVEMLFPFGGIAPLSVIGLSELPEPVQRE